MEATEKIRQKLAQVIGNLIRRCIDDARRIPYILDQEQIVDILVANPSFFAKLVQEEQHDHTAFASDRLTAKMDAFTELGQFEALDSFDVSFSSRIEADADLQPVLDLVNRLTRTFVVYFGNLLTIFEKEFQMLMERFRNSARQGGSQVDSVEFLAPDMLVLEREAELYLQAGQFLQALSFDRLLNSEVISNQAVRLPSSGYAFKRNLIRCALSDRDRFSALVRFVLQACYISQGTWEDNFVTLIDVVDSEKDPRLTALLVDRIELDGIFCCNLLCESFASLKKWPPAQRRSAIESKMDACRAMTGSVWPSQR